ncbi:hypothetical protein PC41400_21500 [Paenibacillus chitinolyticus]|uniref:Helix-turn-helix domain-containing protein n=1 Tax=Paenibacillus chitinolyticus TaxID=79263 RepID=A0A410X0W6_9BACL|nr:hypothetical protein PC41400_21500 [Paenibacillus chitinolyticus]
MLLNNEHMILYNKNACSLLGGGVIDVLSDTERKVLRILYNFSNIHHCMPDLSELETKSGYNQENIKQALSTLREQGYIMGKKLSEVKIIEGWPREKKEEKKTYINPWMD